MLQKIKIYSVLMMTVLSFLSCTNELSLQRFFIDSKENDYYLALDIPSSILEMKDQNPSQEMIDIAKTIRKINFLGFQLTEDSKVSFLAEKTKVKAILKQETYHELMRINSGKIELMVKFLGNEDAIDEVVIYGADKEKGFLVMRVLGTDMNPASIFKMLKNVKIDEDNLNFNQLKDILSSKN
ncbi:MAG: hypothetical protein COB98_03570 [Flavobacteriaceae bacterium]|nr:MAG: hypothetical protein COB98_03570 [Flavobacteriaceae bacterium]